MVNTREKRKAFKTCKDVNNSNGNGGRLEQSRIRNFFNTRKRPSQTESEDETVDSLGKRLKADIFLNDACESSVFGNKENQHPLTRSHCKVSTALFENVSSSQRLFALKSSGRGNFQILPAELLLHMFSLTNVRLLGNLSLLSREMQRLVVDYIFTGGGKRRFFEETKINVYVADRDKSNDPFHCWGSLLKAVTCTNPTADRIQLLEQFYQNHRHIRNHSGWGRLFMMVMQSWGFGECAKVFKAVMQFDNGRAQKDIDKVLSIPVHGSDLTDETKVREFMRAVFFDHNFADIRDEPFWTSLVLRSRTTVNEQARLLMILYAPTKTENGRTLIDWKSLCDIAPASVADAKRRVEPFSCALEALQKTKELSFLSFEWCEHDIFALIEEVTTLPEPWALDNFAAMLLLRPVLTPVALVSRCLHGYEQEAGQIVNAIKTLIYRWKLPPSYYLAVSLQTTMQQIGPLPTRRLFFYSIMTAFFNRITELTNDNSISSRRDLDEELSSYSMCRNVWTSLLPYI